jgi:hypothetical protein
MNIDEILKEKDKAIEDMIKHHIVLEVVLGISCFITGFMLGYIL